MNSGNQRWIIIYFLISVAVVYYIVHLSRKHPENTTPHSVVNVVTDIIYHQNVSECQCSRKFFYPPSEQLIDTDQLHLRFNSSCSDEGTFYQADQNVISFALYVNQKPGNNKKELYYREGLLQNLKEMRSFYPGFSLRIYTDVPLTAGPNCNLICNNTDVFWCNMKATPSHGDLSGMVFRTWRFVVLGDPTVNVFLSRDLDSLISAREVAVVEEWLRMGDKAISLMRDRNFGHDIPILAGMWQASNNKLGMNVASSIREEIISLSKEEKEHKYRSSDQSILDRVIFYPRASDIVAYDSYHCIKWGNFTAVRPYPTQRGDPTKDFVGNQVDFLHGGGRWNYSKNVCPKECRPEYGKNWTYC